MTLTLSTDCEVGEYTSQMAVFTTVTSTIVPDKQSVRPFLRFIGGFYIPYAHPIYSKRDWTPAFPNTDVTHYNILHTYLLRPTFFLGSE